MQRVSLQGPEKLQKFIPKEPTAVNEDTSISFCAQSLALAAVGCSYFADPLKYEHVQDGDGKPVVTKIIIPRQIGRTLAIELQRYFNSKQDKGGNHARHHSAG